MKKENYSLSSSNHATIAIVQWLKANSKAVKAELSEIETKLTIEGQKLKATGAIEGDPRLVDYEARLNAFKAVSKTLKMTAGQKVEKARYDKKTGKLAQYGYTIALEVKESEEGVKARFIASLRQSRFQVGCGNDGTVTLHNLRSNSNHGEEDIRLDKRVDSATRDYIKALGLDGKKWANMVANYKTFVGEQWEAAMECPYKKINDLVAPLTETLMAMAESKAVAD